jgi:prepilin-type N-terminal cleavage/methylation domain-containing protein
MADRRPTSRLRFGSQRGLSLLETIVALSLFALSAATTGRYLVNQIRLSTSNYLSTQAYALAEEQLESTRALRFNDMVPGTKTVPVDGRNFVVTTEILNDTPANGLKQITVDVSWTDPLGPKNVAVHTIYTEVQRF